LRRVGDHYALPRERHRRSAAGRVGCACARRVGARVERDRIR